MLNKIFLEHEDDLVRATTHKVMKYKVMLDAEELTQDEYKELVNDSLDIRQIEKATDDLDKQIELKKVFDMLKTLALLAGGII